MKPEMGKPVKVKKEKWFRKTFIERFGIDALNYEVPTIASS